MQSPPLPLRITLEAISLFSKYVFYKNESLLCLLGGGEVLAHPPKTVCHLSNHSCLLVGSAKQGGTETHVKGALRLRMHYLIKSFMRKYVLLQAVSHVGDSVASFQSQS